MSAALAIREAQLGDAPAYLASVQAHWGATVVSRGVVHVLAGLPALLAEYEGRPAGCLTFAGSGEALEIVTLDAFVPGQGVGRALLRAVAPKAERIWLVTTNDNASAQRFFAGIGMVHVAIHRGAVTRARTQKPRIPLVGEGGVPIEDEYEYEWRPRGGPVPAAGAPGEAPIARAVSIRRLAAHEWPLYRFLRIRALSDAPDAFSSTLEEALSRTEAQWAQQLAGAREDLDLPLVAEDDGALMENRSYRRMRVPRAAMAAPGRWRAPAGLVWGRIESSGPRAAHLYQMWVAPDYRGRGVARRLLDAVVDWARRAGAREVLLGVTRGNDAAVGLYASAGFEPTGSDEPLRPGSDQVVQSMRLDLGKPTG